MQLSLKDQDFVILDLETTGLYAAEGDQAIEFGAVKVSQLQVQEENFLSFVNPQRSIPEASSAIHGIKDEDVKNAPGIEEVLPGFLKFAGSRIWVAQNAAFDLSFILRDMQKLKIPFGDRLIIDTVKVSKILFPNATSHNLDVLMARMGISKSGARHRSLDDCRYTALVLIEFIKLLEKQGMDQLHHLKDAFIKPESVLKPEKPKARGLFG